MWHRSNGFSNVAVCRHVGMVAGSISRRAGGLFYSVRSLAKEISNLGAYRVDVHSFADSHSAEDVLQWAPLVPTLHPTIGPSAIGYSPAMRRGFFRGGYDILHTQGIWQWPSAAAHQWHVKMGKPYLVSPRGMLDPWALSRSRAKKWIASRWFEAAHLRDASCLHALCQSEAESMREYGLKNPICVIPNGIELPKPGDLSRVRDVESDLLRGKSGVKTLLFISRLHPKKGMRGAIDAWATVFSSPADSELANWRLVIAGWDQQGHEAELQNRCVELGIKHRCISVAEFVAGDHSADSAGSITFIGPAYGNLKDALLRKASAFILPSFSEGLPMAVLEAWAYCLPVLMTSQCNLPEGFAADAAISIGTDAASIAAGLRTLFGASDAQRLRWGENGRRLVEGQFTWPQLARQMSDVYRWVLGEGPKPNCMFAD